MKPPTTTPPSSELTVLITAHPDDESMFFVPTLHSLTSASASPWSSSKSQPLQQVWLLCLTTGNCDGLGEVRSRELKRAAEQILRVDRTILLDDPRFPDDPAAAWDPGVVAGAIRKALLSAAPAEAAGGPSNNAQGPAGLETLRLVTFDADGVSGHVNHRDTFLAVRELLVQSTTENDNNKHGKLLDARRVEAWSLQTVHNPVAKYIPLLEWVRLWLSWCGILAARSSQQSSRNGSHETHRLWQPSLNWKAMAAHRSQFVWYRRLFVVFSCYTYVNRLQRVVVLLWNDDHQNYRSSSADILAQRRRKEE